MFFLCRFKKFGQYRIRTCGLFHVKETRYQLRQLSVRGFILTEQSLGSKFSVRLASPVESNGEKDRRHPDLNWGMELLQSSALPLGYAAKISPPLEAVESIVCGLYIVCQRDVRL